MLCCSPDNLNIFHQVELPKKRKFFFVFFLILNCVEISYHIFQIYRHVFNFMKIVHVQIFNDKVFNLVYLMINIQKLLLNVVHVLFYLWSQLYVIYFISQIYLFFNFVLLVFIFCFVFLQMKNLIFKLLHFFILGF